MLFWLAWLLRFYTKEGMFVLFKSEYALLLHRDVANFYSCCYFRVPVFFCLAWIASVRQCSVTFHVSRELRALSVFAEFEISDFFFHVSLSEDAWSIW